MRTSSNIRLFLIFLYFAWIAPDKLFTFMYFNSYFAEGANINKPGCLTKCGNLTVSYPFGISANSSCSINPFFAINCDVSFDPPKAFLGIDNVEVLGISEAKISVKNRLAVQCYREDGAQTEGKSFFMNLSSTPSCAAICSKPGELSNGFCSGIGCCQSSIPKGLQSTYVYMDSDKGHTKVHNFSSCGYSFLAEQSSYDFNISDISDSSFVSRIIETVPVVIDWAIGNQTCNQTNEIICQPNSVCVDSASTLGGYRCSCSPGYQGNPYLSPGCQDINECDSKPCHQDATCTNLPGSFNCSCPLHHIGDGRNHGTGCFYVSPPRKAALYAGSLAGLGLFLILIISFWSYKILKKRSLKQIKQNLFKRNGGLLLQQQMSAHDRVLEKMRIFTSKELEKATDKFNESRILGRGGQGTVYKGMLSDGRIVAVKKSKQVNQNQLEEFINEVVLLSQVNHRNVVKLLGCCLETEVPLQVYEFIPNGTLYHLIHDHDNGIPFSWDIRLRIATEIANALAYLHYATSVPIYHRDMKSTNILLDEKYKAKLSDFGISRLAAIDQTHLTTKVQGTFGYLDPEYFQTGKLTEKSDVYSFGVVLVELLTGQKPIETSMAEDEMSLVTRFLLTMEENRLKAILDSRITEQGVIEEHIVVSNLAKRCLNLNGKKRPTVREVVTELESIKSYENPSFVESDIQDISYTDDGDSWIQSAEFMVENRG
ncbi:hypothetical protein C2S52_008765 [Perilla frutescens var. hirtella]|nr:hypothetical protein C2S52_008765 [Perilla frutescens var. hirtella]